MCTCVLITYLGIYMYNTHKFTEQFRWKVASVFLSSLNTAQRRVNFKVRLYYSRPCLVKIYRIKLLCKTQSQPFTETACFLSARFFFLHVW